MYVKDNLRKNQFPGSQLYLSRLFMLTCLIYSDIIEGHDKKSPVHKTINILVMNIYNTVGCTYKLSKTYRLKSTHVVLDFSVNSTLNLLLLITQAGQYLLNSMSSDKLKIHFDIIFSFAGQN